MLGHPHPFEIESTICVELSRFLKARSLIYRLRFYGFVYLAKRNWLSLSAVMEATGSGKPFGPSASLRPPSAPRQLVNLAQISPPSHPPAALEAGGKEKTAMVDNDGSRDVAEGSATNRELLAQEVVAGKKKKVAKPAMKNAATRTASMKKVAKTSGLAKIAAAKKSAAQKAAKNAIAKNAAAKSAATKNAAAKKSAAQEKRNAKTASTSAETNKKKARYPEEENAGSSNDQRQKDAMTLRELYLLETAKDHPQRGAKKRQLIQDVRDLLPGCASLIWCLNSV